MTTSAQRDLFASITYAPLPSPMTFTTAGNRAMSVQLVPEPQPHAPTEFAVYPALPVRPRRQPDVPILPQTSPTAARLVQSVPPQRTASLSATIRFAHFNAMLDIRYPAPPAFLLRTT